MTKVVIMYTYGLSECYSIICIWINIDNTFIAYEGKVS